MALEIEWNYNNEKIRAYVRIMNINIRKSTNGNVEGGRGVGVSTVSSNNEKLPEKQFTLHYKYEIVFEDNIISTGEHMLSYDLNSNVNIYTCAYDSLKNNVARFKEALNV